ncbi:collagen alpha-2(IV) chain-like [Clarias magur]|uniref:Collagen alpha-2(IV) chain-like n=1 Tax=Clarias magur TaxID=1594786 RepID=A0A8J4TQU8_CLAMG|nr:collagen alpha-2(IV) chain-like [Clarias magur]
MVQASPARYTRQVEPDNYDEDLDTIDVEYYEELATDEPEEELRLTPTEILHISGDSLGSGDMQSSGSSGAFGASGISGNVPGASGEHLGSAGSGGSADVSFGDISSEGSVDIGSEVYGDFVSGESGELGSGVSGEPVSGVSGGLVSGVSGYFVSGTSGDVISEISGDFVSEVSGDIVSGASGDIVSGASGDIVSGVPGEFLSGASGDLVSGDFGSLVSEVSAESGSGASGDVVSGVSEESGSGASGDVVSGDSLESGSGASGNLVSGVSSGSGSGPSGVPDEEIILIPGDKDFEITVTKGPEESIKDEEIVTEIPLFSGEPVTTVLPWEEVTIIPTTINEEEELPPTTQISLEEGTGSTPGSGVPESPEPDGEVVEFDGQGSPHGMPTCMLCTCLERSVYCDDVRLLNVPPLPKDTTHFYARFNRITKINKSDFANMNKLKRIDLTSNSISKIEDGAFFGLPALEELVIRENGVAQLPALPATMTLVDASHNHLGRTSIQNEAFKDMTRLLYLYLTDNSLDHIPVPLPESLRSLHLQNNNIQMIHEDTFCKQNDMNYVRMALEDIRLDGNPINLSNTPQAYVCLPRIPVGALI